MSCITSMLLLWDFQLGKAQITKRREVGTKQVKEQYILCVFIPWRRKEDNKWRHTNTNDNHKLGFTILLRRKIMKRKGKDQLHEQVLELQ